LQPVPIYRLSSQIAFPSPELAAPGGILAVGGDLSAERLVLAYSMGIFPWYSEGDPIMWHSPEPRFALTPGELHVPRSLAKVCRRAPFALSCDRAFAEVIGRCGKVRRPGQRGTWITRDMQKAYIRLHELGVAHSVEARAGGKLVGGLYGVALGAVFFGESMFADAADASKVAFVSLVAQLGRWGFSLIDCQQETAHLARFGATAWPRARFLAALAPAVHQAGRPGKWHLDADLAGAA
jgi:leucyl/phenylalanyl-tRNA--protein transferase